jgi:hypothetical protein
MLPAEQRQQDLQQLSLPQLVAECFRVAPWMYATERAARQLMIEALLSVEFRRRDAGSDLGA